MLDDRGARVVVDRERGAARATRRQDDEDAPAPAKRILLDLFESLRDDLFIIVVGALFALVRAMGVTVQSGQTGLLFTCGRARKEIPPGFRPLIPFLQQVKKMPTRSRTLDLPAQRVATFQGLVYHVDANVVYRIIDIRKALIQIDVLETGMRQMLGLGVQEVLRRAPQEAMHTSEHLDRDLAANLAERLEPWGVEVERAGFTSIAPSPKTLRLTQLGEVVNERRAMYERLRAAGIERRRALGLVGPRRMPRPKTLVMRRRAGQRRRMARLRRLLMRRGWMPVQIKQAELSLRSRITAGGKLKVAPTVKE